MQVDGLVDTSRSDGLAVLQGSAASSPVSAEALIWAGGTVREGSPQPAAFAGDALVFALDLHDKRGLTNVRLGRFVYTSGAIRPVEIDGGSVLVRSPWGTKIEAVAGAPVVGGFGPRDFDWMAGGRISQTVASRLTVGASYVQRRQSGDLADEEVGADVSAIPFRWLHVAARASYDLLSPGISEALVSAAARAGPLRLELFGVDRSPSRLLLDTSIFSIFGDFPSQSLGSSLYWKAAPRLDVWLTGAAQSVGGVYGGNGSVRALLRLDDRGAGSLGLEVRRQDVSTARWTGVRFTSTKRLSRWLRCSTELEVVVADDPQGKGVAWPWGLVSLAWRPSEHWELAGAVEAASTPEHLFETNVLARLSLFLGAAK